MCGFLLTSRVVAVLNRGVDHGTDGVETRQFFTGGSMSGEQSRAVVRQTVFRFFQCGFQQFLLFFACGELCFMADDGTLQV